MAITIDDLVYSVGLDDSDMKTGANRIQKTIRGLSEFAAGAMGAFAMPLSMMSGFDAFGEAVGRAGKAIVDFSRDATVFNTVERSFQNLAASAGQSGNAVLSAMKEATAGTVDSLTLMQQANQALMLGLEVTPERMTDLMQIARSAAQSTGKEFSYMVESIIGGLGRQERDILDNLGIIVRADDANQKYAESIDKTASELTEAERKQAFMNEALRIGTQNLEKAGGVQASATEKFQTMDVAVKDLQYSIGRLFAPATTGLISSFATGISNLADGLMQLPPLFEDAQDKADRLTRSFQDAKTTADTQIETITDLQSQYNELNQQLDDENLSAEESRRLHDELNKIIAKMSQSVPGLTSIFRQYGNDVGKVNEHLERSKTLHREILEGDAQRTAQSLRQAYLEAVKAAEEGQKRLEVMQTGYTKRLAMTAAEREEAFIKMSIADAAGAKALYGSNYQEFRKMLLKEGQDLQQFKKDVKAMNADIGVQTTKLGNFVELYGLDDAVEGMRELNKAAYPLGKLTGENVDKMADFQAIIRDTFGLGVEEAEKFIQILLNIPKAVKTSGGGLGDLKDTIADMAKISKEADDVIWKSAEATGQKIAAYNKMVIEGAKKAAKERENAAKDAAKNAIKAEEERQKDLTKTIADAVADREKLLKDASKKEADVYEKLQDFKAKIEKASTQEALDAQKKEFQQYVKENQAVIEGKREIHRLSRGITHL